MAIALVRENAEAMRPPRALWVSFPLGRPFGAPDDVGLQARVLEAALDLLVTAPAHGTLADFPEDAPAMTAEDMEGLVCPVPLPRRPAPGRVDHAAAVAAEIALLEPHYVAAKAARGRTTFGVSGLDLDGVVAFLAALAAGGSPGPAPGLSLAQTLRFASEDLRTWYVEAASARPGAQASPAALADWFWGETAAGTLLLAIASVCRTHSDPSIRAVAARTLVPRTQERHLAKPS